MNENAKPVLVIGGGIAGMTAALEAAETGYRVILVEQEAYLGGRVVKSNRYFPKMCPPTCGFEINARRIKQNPRITVFTLANVEEITGKAGNFNAVIKIRPSYISKNAVIDQSIIENMKSERDNEFNSGLDKTKALYIPHDMAYPADYILDREALSDIDAGMLKSTLPEDTLDLEQQEKVKEFNVGSVIIATGWKPYDADKLDTLGYGRFPNVITNVVMERIASKGGPTGGIISRPSDGKKVENIAFVQCAGSRDENHLPYCSAVCCMASLKQARYLREQNPASKATVFYIDIRTIGRLEKFYYDMLDDENITFIKGKVASIDEEPGTGNLILDVEDTISRETLHKGFDMVVLATGIQPNSPGFSAPVDLETDAYGFMNGTTNIPGLFAVGCSRRPCDVSKSTKDSTAAALKAIQILNGGD